MVETTTHTVATRRREPSDCGMPVPAMRDLIPADPANGDARFGLLAATFRAVPPGAAIGRNSAASFIDIDEPRRSDETA